MSANELSEVHAKDMKMLSGWDNDYHELHGIFMARGPAFKIEHKIPSIEIVDIYQVRFQHILFLQKHHVFSW